MRPLSLTELFNTVYSYDNWGNPRYYDLGLIDREVKAGRLVRVMRSGKARYARVR